VEVAVPFRCALRIGLVLMCPSLRLSAQLSANQQSAMWQSAEAQSPSDEFTHKSDPQAEQELQNGTALTRSSSFAEAIPHLLAAQGRVANEYAADFNLALCYVATGQPEQAIPILTALRDGGHDNADVNNLLAQAYVGDGQNERALDTLQRAAAFAPENEKLYLFVADACMEKREYVTGLQVVEVGLHHLPDSPWLHYERGMFLALLDQFDVGKSDFELAGKLAPESDVAFVASAQEEMFEGHITKAIGAAREGVRKGHQDYTLLTLLGEALLRSGIAPGQPEFAEARSALEKAAGERSNYASAQIALGKVYLLENRLGDAVAHLEMARQLDPNNASVYSRLAVAYRRQGAFRQAQDALSNLVRLNQAQADKIRYAPGDRKVSYGGHEERPQ
jgi:tetratricopeptide (TPR) repeat protein